MQVNPWIDFRVMMEAGQAVLQGINPYTIEWRFYTPVWSLPMLALLSTLPLLVSATIWTTLLVGSWGAFLYKVSNKDMLSVIIFMCNPFFIHGLIMGSYDWVVVAGALLPFQYGAWMMALKPQVAFISLLVWLKSLRSRWAFLVVGAISLVFALSCVLGMYRKPDLSEMYWNTSLFPYSIPIGLILAWVSLKKNDGVLALASAPLLSPYVGIQSWAFVLLPFIKKRSYLLLAVMIGWLI